MIKSSYGGTSEKLLVDAVRRIPPKLHNCVKNTVSEFREIVFFSGRDEVYVEVAPS